MAVVLSAENVNYFAHSPSLSPAPSSSSTRNTSALQRTYSQSRLAGQSSSSGMLKRSKSSSNFYTQPQPSPPPSSNSSAASSPRTRPVDSSTASSYASTPATAFSLDTATLDADDEDISFPSYDHDDDSDDDAYSTSLADLEPLPKSYTVSTPEEQTSSAGSSSNLHSRPDSPAPIDLPQDDIQLCAHPTRHVDYLSHDWKEEEISASWRHIVSKRGRYNNSARLENASWRTWAKARGRLRTVHAEQLNWLKDCDVTWLYGPLQTANERYYDSTPSVVHGHLSKSPSFLRKKPILKKRSMSEIMLQRSLSSSSLLKQATASIHAQQSQTSTPRPSVSRATSTSNYIDFSLVSRRPSHDQTATRSSITSSGFESPDASERKHIHFNEQVEQCIAVEVPRTADEEELDAYNAMFPSDESEDDNPVMMRRTPSKLNLPYPVSRRTISRHNSGADSKTIAMLPSTKLKYREDEESILFDTPSQALKHSGWSGRLITSSPSSETLRPATHKPSRPLLLGDDEEDMDEDIDWQPPVNTFPNRKDSLAVTHDRLLHHMDMEEDPYAEPEEYDDADDEDAHGFHAHAGGSGSGGSNLRRTSSGMFMPPEQDEDDGMAGEGILGKVVGAANTARDIAHVIWNVGWRR